MYLEDVGEVAQVEDVVELDGGGQEGVRHAVVQRDGAVHHRRAHLDDAAVEGALLQVLRQDAVVDAVKSRATCRSTGAYKMFITWPAVQASSTIPS